MRVIFSIAFYFAETDRFISILSSFSQIMERKQKAIDEAKLRAIGFRNQVESEIELRKRKQVELEALIEEKQNEVDRY